MPFLRLIRNVRKNLLQNPFSVAKQMKAVFSPFTFLFIFLYYYIYIIIFIFLYYFYILFYISASIHNTNKYPNFSMPFLRLIRNVRKNLLQNPFSVAKQMKAVFSPFTFLFIFLYYYIYILILFLYFILYLFIFLYF